MLVIEAEDDVTVVLTHDLHIVKSPCLICWLINLKFELPSFLKKKLFLKTVSGATEL